LAFSETDGYCTGQPKPQYVPVCTPWVYEQRFLKDLIPGTLTAYCEESQVCCGAYLPSSTEQVRRTTNLCNGNLGQSATTVIDTTLGSPNSTNVKIIIQNLMCEGQQIILPDEMTASIVHMAVNGDISLLSHSCKTYRNTINSADTQNLILPIKIASANALFVFCKILK
jgi:hypothetical protein